jgi:hypothetical protein
LLLLLMTAFSLSAQGTVTPLPGVTPQRALALSAFATPVAVEVHDDRGRPVPGVMAYLSEAGHLQLAPGASGDCWIDFMIVLVCRVATDAQGVARFPALVSRYADTFTARVTATNDAYPNTIRYGETTLQFTADPLQTPARLVVISGNDQAAVIGTALAPIGVRLEDVDGRPRSHARLWYSPSTYGAGGFQLPESPGPAEVTTDENGRATLPTFVVGWGVGVYEAQVRYFDPQAAAYVEAPIRYTATNARGGLTLSLGDLWWGGLSESGWGMTVAQHGDRLFNVWFVYDDLNRPTWFVQSSGQWSQGLGSTFHGPLYWPRGSPWFAYDASRFAVGAQKGTASVSFRGPEEGWVSFHADQGASIVTFNKPVARQQFGRGVAAPIQGVGDLWWGGASQNGWGLAIHEQEGTLFIVWFTYDAEGLPTWFVMPGGAWTEVGAYAGSVYRTTGPSWTLQSFDASQVQVSPVGAFELRFASTQKARMDVTIEGRSVSLDLVRQPY